MIGNPIGSAIGEPPARRVPPNAITSRQVLDDPVNCVLAGQQEKHKPMRLGAAAVRNAFGD